MEEPNWDEYEDTKHSTISKDDLVWIQKKSRGRFPDSMEKAVKGDHGIVISSWTSNMGSHKICILTSDLRELGTTATCARIIGNINTLDDDSWLGTKLTWMDKTYIPLIVNKVPGYKPGTWAISKNRSSLLVQPLSSQDRIWLSKEKVHPHDWAELFESEGACCAVRVPVWLAKKGGVFGVV